MTNTFEHSGQEVFRARVKRVDAHFYRHGVSKREYTNVNKRPLLSVLLGFAWIYFVIKLVENREFLKASLAQGSIGADAQTWIMGGLGLLIILTLFMMGVFAVRIVTKRRDQRGAAGSILAGGAAAMMLVATPPYLYQELPFKVLNGSQGAVMAALNMGGGSSLDDINLDVDVKGLALVSSLGQ